MSRARRRRRGSAAVDEVLPADEAGAVEIGVGADAAVDDRHGDAAAVRAAIVPRRQIAEADRQARDTHRTRRCEAEHRVVGNDLGNEVRGAERQDLLRSEVGGDRVDGRELGEAHATRAPRR